MSEHDVNTERLAQEIAEWHDRLQEAIEGTRFENVRVLAQCASTQDVAKALEPSFVVTTGMQYAGRGRPGKEWHDPGAGGVAMSLVVVPQSAARLSTASVLAVLDVVDQLAIHPGALGAKFPNDVVDSSGRKLAGVLIEGDARQSVIGIGMNVRKTTPPAFAGAVSLEELSIDVGRIEVMEVLLRTLDRRLEAADSELAHEFDSRHLLLGGDVRISWGHETVEGVLRAANPFDQLVVESSDGVHAIPAAQATIEHWSLPAH